MRRALVLLILSSCIFAQTAGPTVPVRSIRESPGADSVEVRLTRVEVALSQIQKQLDDNTSQIRALNTQFTDFRVQLADLNTKVNLIMWIGGILGALSIGSMWKMIFDRKEPAPQTPAWPPYSTPTGYGMFGPPYPDIERIVRRVLEEERRNEPPVVSSRTQP